MNISLEFNGPILESEQKDVMLNYISILSDFRILKQAKLKLILLCMSNQVILTYLTDDKHYYSRYWRWT